jgi:hypothetical protein
MEGDTSCSSKYINVSPTTVFHSYPVFPIMLSSLMCP